MVKLSSAAKAGAANAPIAVADRAQAIIARRVNWINEAIMSLLIIFYNRTPNSARTVRRARRMHVGMPK